MSRKKILVVDDNEVILKMLSLKLKANNYDVVTATEGSEAVGAVRTQRPDLILLDIGFPPEVAGITWDGFGIIQWLRRVEEGKKTPIIIITGEKAANYKERALAEGAAAFFHKPIDNDELLVVIQKVLADNPAPAPAAD